MKHTETVVALPILMSPKSFYNIPAYQRAGDAWSLADQQLLMDSLLRQYALPKIYIRPQGARKELLDGQQRCTAIKGFLNDAFPMSKDAAPVEVDGEKYDCAGMTYSELPEALQDVLHQTSLVMVKIEQATNEEVRDYFLRLQKGSPLNPAEKRRALGGSMPKIIKHITGCDLFNHVGYKANRLAHEATAAQLMLISLSQGPCKLSSSELDTMYLEADPKLKTDSQEVQQVVDVLNLMAEMFDHYEEPVKSLKKTMVPALFCALFQLQEIDGHKLDSEKLHQWYLEFLDAVGEGKFEEYSEAVSKSVDSLDSVTTRVDTLVNSIAQKFSLKSPE